MTTLDKRQVWWEASFLAAGHQFDPEKEHDKWFSLAHGMHSGPKCTRCNWYLCVHCTRLSNIPKCTAEKVK